MTGTALSLEELREEVARGAVDTVRVCFTDHYGMLRGRRLVGEVYAEDPEAPQGYCDGALVWDVHCDIFEETDYSNFRTGYPDLLAFPDLGSLRRCGWSEGSAMVLTKVTDPHGERSPLDPRGILGQVVERSGAGPVGITLSLRAGLGPLEPGWSPEPAPGFSARWRAGIEGSGISVDELTYDPASCRATVELAPLDPVAAADAAIVARSSAREIGLVDGVTVTTLGRLEDGAPDELMEIRPEGGFPEDGNEAARLEDLALLARPLPLGWPAGGLVRDAAVLASASANPYLATAAALVAAADETTDTSPGTPDSYAAAADRLAGAGWAVDWLGEMFIHDTLEIARREAALRQEGCGSPELATGWDVARYGEVG